MISAEGDITVGYTVTDVNVSESDGVAMLTVEITMPIGENPSETSFSLLANTLDGGLPWRLEFNYVPMYSVTNHSLALVKLHNIILTHSLVPRPSPTPVFDRLQAICKRSKTGAGEGHSMQVSKNWNPERPGN